MAVISVVIPCYEMYGFGVQFLNKALLSLSIQTFKDFEVVVSDHSKDDLLEKLCQKFHGLNIKYIRFEEKRGSSSANVNNGIRNSSGKIIKILCQDDYLFDENSLMRNVKLFQRYSNKFWMVSKYIHTTNETDFFNEHLPRWNDHIHFNNTIGTHSCLSFINENPSLFDENLIWFMDCELYRRLKERYGLPIVLNNITIVNRIWPGTVTNTLATEEVRKKEYFYLIQKYGG